MPNAKKDAKENIKDNLVVVKFEDFMKKCDYKWKHEFKDYCRHEPQEDRIGCSFEECPFVQYIVEGVKVESSFSKPNYVV